MGRIGGDDLAGDEPVEQHADGGEVLLDRRLFEILAERLDIGGDMQRLDIGDLTEFVLIAPGEEPHDGVVIGRPRVLVADGGGEELQKAARGLSPASAITRGTTTPWWPATLFSGRVSAGARAFDSRPDSMALSVT
jgi:hypothetical protein